ncbi:MAG: hypothetical protein Q4D94_09130 [Bacillota bacterium]|nr:hypothetical protein [Bacillota bacterium]
MDKIYQAVKGLLKAFVNLFAAVIDLIAGVFDGLAGILGKLRPRASQRLSEIREKGFEGGNADADSRLHKVRKIAVFSGNEEELVDAIRKELQEKVTSRERYFYLYAKAGENGNAVYCVILAILAFALFASTMLYSVGSVSSTRILAAVIMAVLCIIACVAIAKYRKKIMRNRIVRIILEEEFKDREWCKIHPITEVSREENNSTKKELVQRAENL